MIEFNASIVEGVGRVYTSGKYRYPSVTTVLQVVGDNTYLDDWREKVGAEFADAYTQFACDIGSAMHDDYEQVIAGNPLKECLTDAEKQARKMFRASLPKFNKLIKEPIAQEVAVYSHVYKVAGRFDLLARGHDGKVYLLDFKNTKRDKTREDIDSYRLQLGFYHRMLAECMPDVKIDEHLVFMVNREGFVKQFRFAIDDVTDLELKRVRGRFYGKFGL